MTTAMVVMEPGSDWPGQIGESMNVLACGLAGDDLLRRTQEKLGALHRSEKRPRVAVLACSSSTDREAAERRVQLARALLDAVADSNCGRLILSASGRASQDLRQELLALAGVLTAEIRGTTATVLLRFLDVSPSHAGHSEQTTRPPIGASMHA